MAVGLGSSISTWVTQWLRGPREAGGMRVGLQGRADPARACSAQHRNPGSGVGQELEKHLVPIPATILPPTQLLPPEKKELSLVWSALGFINHDHGEQGPRHIILAVPSNTIRHRQQEQGSARCERLVTELTWGSAPKDAPEAHGSFRQYSFQAVHRN